MKRSSSLLLVSALTLAAGTALVARVLMTPPPPVVKQVAAAPEPVTYMLAANRDLEPGDFIDATALQWLEAPEDNRSAGRYTVQDNAPRREVERSLYGATLRRAVPGGQPLTRDLPVYPGEPGFLAAVLAPGMRAISIPTSALSSNAGLVSAGDWVDVILSLDRDVAGSPDSADSSYTKLAAQTVLRRVRVLALNNNAASIAPSDSNQAADGAAAKRAAKTPATPPRMTAFLTMTLEVTPAAAERLAVAKEVGTLQVALRGVKDSADDMDGGMVADATAPAHVTRLTDTTQIFRASPATAAAPKVKTFHGDKAATVTFGGAN